MSNANWREDDLARGLAADLFNLSGLGVEDSQIGAYDMSYVFHLFFFVSFHNAIKLQPIQGHKS